MASTRGHFLSGKKIIVAGAGMAGLSFVASMRKQWDSSLPPPQIIICDRDTKEISASREGYSLALAGADEDGGLYVMKDLGLLDDIMGHALLGQGETASFKLWTEEWKELISLRLQPAPGLPSSGIRIARKDLRGVLTASVSATTDIRWATSCVAVSQLDDGKMRVRMRDSETGEEHDEDCDFVIAADGASSKLRGCLRPDDGLQYAGVVQMGGVAKFDGPVPPPIDHNWGGVLTGQGAYCFFAPSDKGSIIWAISVREPTPRGPFDNQDPKQVEAMLDEARKHGRSIAEPFPTLVDKTAPSTTLLLSARDKQPIQHDQSLGPIVFIGDSNHAVSPFAGNGANLALKDGWDLTEKLCKSASFADAVSAFDKSSTPRALATLKTSHERITLSHSTGVQYWAYRASFAFAWIMTKLMGWN